MIRAKLDCDSVLEPLNGLRCIALDRRAVSDLAVQVAAPAEDGAGICSSAAVKRSEGDLGDAAIEPDDRKRDATREATLHAIAQPPGAV